MGFLVLVNEMEVGMPGWGSASFRSLFLIDSVTQSYTQYLSFLSLTHSFFHRVSFRGRKGARFRVVVFLAVAVMASWPTKHGLINHFHL